MAVKLKDENLIEIIKQVSRFDNQYKYVYYFKILSLCINYKKNNHFINKKKFIKYLTKFRNFNENILQNINSHNEIYKLFISEVKFLLRKIKKFLLDVYPNFFFFNFSKTRKTIEEHIFKIEIVLKKLTPFIKNFNIKKYNSISVMFFRNILKNIFELFNNKNKNNKVYFHYGKVISKIYYNIENKINRRQILNFFFNSVLVISVNSALFTGVFFIKDNFLKSKIKKYICINLITKPLKLGF